MEPFGKSIKRRKEIWEAMHPVGKLEVEQLVPPQDGSHGGARPQREQFASATSEIPGEAFAKGFPEGLT